MPNRPPPLRTDTSNAFARQTVGERLPSIFRDTVQRNPDYPQQIKDAVLALAEDLESDRELPMLDLPAPDYHLWQPKLAARPGERWLQSEWIFAEPYAYRLLIQAVRFWQTLRDPFAPIKAEEYATDALWLMLGEALERHAEPGSAEDHISAALYAALWGNRMDLSFAASLAHGTATRDDDLLVDDSAVLVAAFTAQPGQNVHIVADNAGTEFTMDLVLADVLLKHGVGRVCFHLKMHPTYVSDTTVPDVLNFIRTLESGERGTAALDFGKRLREALETDRIRLIPDFFWNGSGFLWDLPPHLLSVFDGPTLTKGDLNYRRLVGDAIWVPETPFAEVMDYFSMPIGTLRTLKSDPIVGLPEGLVAQLDTIDSEWRVNGRRGVIQAKHG